MENWIGYEIELSSRFLFVFRLIRKNRGRKRGG